MTNVKMEPTHRNAPTHARVASGAQGLRLERCNRSSHLGSCGTMLRPNRSSKRPTFRRYQRFWLQGGACWDHENRLEHPRRAVESRSAVGEGWNTSQTDRQAPHQLRWSQTLDQLPTTQHPSSN